MKLLIIFLTVFYGSYIVSSNPQKSCSCSEHLETDHRGQQIGKCKTQFGGKSWCYIPSNSNCGDKKKSKRGSFLFWSHIACQFKPSPSQQENFVVTGGLGYPGLSRLSSVELITAEGVCTSSTIPPLPVSLVRHESVYHQGNLMVCGGSSSKCYLLKNANAEWKEGPTMNKARSGFSMIQAENVVYAIGGPDSSIEKLVGGRWELIPQTITTGANSGQKTGHCAVYLKSRKSLVVIGGYTTNKVVALNLLTGEWTDLAPLPVASLHFHSCTISQNVIYVAGGREPSPSPIWQKKVYKYDHEGGSWERVGDLNKGREAFAMDVMDNKPVVVGGWCADGHIDGIESMDENKVWTKTSYSLSEPRHWHSMSAVPREDFGCNT